MLHEGGVDGESHFLLVVLRHQQSSLLRVGEKATFHHDSGIFAEIAEEELLAAQLDLTGVVGLEKFHKLGLDPLGEHSILTVDIGIEHLGAAVLWIGELILMDGDTQGVFLTVEDGEPVIHVGAFLVGDTLDPLVVDGRVRIPGHDHLISGHPQQLPEIQQDGEVDVLFHIPRSGRAPAVHAAMPRIQNNNLAVLRLTGSGDGGAGACAVDADADGKDQNGK